MNADRRKKIEALREKIAEALSGAESIRDEEQDYLDNMPESLQSGEKGEKSQAACEALESLVDHLTEADSDLETAGE